MATKSGQVYKCQVCTNEVKVTAEGAGTLVCCNEPMEVQSER